MGNYGYDLGINTDVIEIVNEHSREESYAGEKHVNAIGWLRSVVCAASGAFLYAYHKDIISNVRIAIISIGMLVSLAVIVWCASKR